MKNKTENLVLALKQRPLGISMEDLPALDLSLVEFHSRKASINNNKKKYNGIQIIKGGKYGSPVWKLAERNSLDTIAYGRIRTLKAIKNIINMKESDMIAMANESSIKVRTQMAGEVSERINKLVQVVTA